MCNHGYEPVEAQGLDADVIQRGEVSAEVAAGIYFLERRALLAALRRLLQAAAAAPADAAAAPEVAEAVAGFAEKLLQQRQDGRPALVARLMTLVQVRIAWWSFGTLQASWRPSKEVLANMVQYAHFVACQSHPLRVFLPSPSMDIT